METFSALLAICAGNSPVPGEFPAQRHVTRSFDVFFDLCLNKPLSKQSWGWRFERLSRPLWRLCNATCALIFAGLLRMSISKFQIVNHFTFLTIHFLDRERLVCHQPDVSLLIQHIRRQWFPNRWIDKQISFKRLGNINTEFIWDFLTDIARVNWLILNNILIIARGGATIALQSICLFVITIANGNNSNINTCGSDVQFSFTHAPKFL